ncbi:MAG: serine hydrolase domain-containing protein [Rhodanobacter sp.]|jgi:CubicO group peptidase (beta-lactamase class C family)
MNPSRHTTGCNYGRRLALRIAFGAAQGIFAAGAAAQPALPATPVGNLGAQIVHHADSDTPVQIRQWAAGILSGSVSREDQASFIDGLVSAVRDGGGLDVFDVRTDPRQPGLLQVAVKAQHGGRRGLLVLAADPAQPGKLAQAALVPMGDPALYADWPRTAVSHAELARLIHATLDRLVGAEDFSGCVTVVDGARTVIDECRGLAERRFGIPVDRETKFHVGSIDKMFTAVAIAQLVQAGKLSWQATLGQLLPEYRGGAAARRITVWQLLHHTSGLGDFLVPEYFEHRETFVHPADYLDLIAKQPRLSEPGKQWNYSNAGYMLLGRIIEKVSGDGYADYIRRHVFAPAGMDASGFDRPGDLTPKLATGYFHDALFSPAWKADWLKIPAGGPAGGGYSRSVDLLRFAKALREGKLVDAATLARMFEDEVPAGPGAYAAGFGDRLSHGRHIRGHAGGIEGTDANLQIVWGTDAAVALTSNEGPGENWLLAEHIADLLAAGHAQP